MIKRIHVRFTLALDSDADRDKVARAFEHYKPRCPVYRSISGSIAITDEVELVELGSSHDYADDLSS